MLNALIWWIYRRWSKQNTRKTTGMYAHVLTYTILHTSSYIWWHTRTHTYQHEVWRNDKVNDVKFPKQTCVRTYEKYKLQRSFKVEKIAQFYRKNVFLNIFSSTLYVESRSFLERLIYDICYLPYFIWSVK